MTARSTYVCDGCCTATVDMPMPEGRALVRLIEVVMARWTSPMRGVWLCPDCAAATDIDGAQTEAMF